MAVTETNTLAQMEAQAQETQNKAEHIAVIDFKMVTFSLAGKDYAIDIMQVKEIAKAGRFTYVPNTSPFVLGVYNLRGDIIPIIDLRIFFNIPTKAREDDALESMIIIHVEEQTFGIVVDGIDKVVGISKSSIQPPHPIFGDINIKYIHGVVENQGRLYIILDVTRIFGSRTRQVEAEKEAIEEAVIQPPLKEKEKKSRDELDISFISDTLAALAKFHVSQINQDWVASRYREWRDSRSAGDVQLRSEEDARQYLSTFPSPETGTIWSDSFSSKFASMLPQNQAKQINVWNIGCGKGEETYSLAVLLKERYPNARIRIYANDSDLLAISNAPMLSVPESRISSLYKPYLVQGTGGSWTFNQTIRDMILFEYHDCTNQNSIPNIDLIVARDVISYLNPKQQAALLADFSEKIKDNGIIVLGQNEAMPRNSGWSRIVHDGLTAFSKE